MESVVTRGRKRDDANLFRLFAAFLAVGGLFWFSFCWGWVTPALYPLYCNSVQDFLRLAIAVCAPYVAAFLFSFGFTYAIGRLPKKSYVCIVGALCAFFALSNVGYLITCFPGRINPAFVPSVLSQNIVYICLKYMGCLFFGYVGYMNLFLLITGALTSKNSKRLALSAAFVLLGYYADNYVVGSLLCHRGRYLYLTLWTFWLWAAIHAILTIVAVAMLTSSSKDTA